MLYDVVELICSTMLSLTKHQSLEIEIRRVVVYVHSWESNGRWQTKGSGSLWSHETCRLFGPRFSRLPLWKSECNMCDWLLYPLSTFREIPWGSPFKQSSLFDGCVCVCAWCYLPSLQFMPLTLYCTSQCIPIINKSVCVCVWGLDILVHGKCDWHTM